MVIAVNVLVYEARAFRHRACPVPRVPPGPPPVLSGPAPSRVLPFPPLPSLLVGPRFEIGFSRCKPTVTDSCASGWIVVCRDRTDR